MAAASCHHCSSAPLHLANASAPTSFAHAPAFAGEEDLAGKRETTAVTTGGGRGRNPNSGERVLCATCQRLIGQSNWSTGQLWSTGQSQQSNSGQFCKNA
ncbi:hypothetical protein DEO72_LG7g1323 [Vigna unguiculata]|uniref:Uncharacterized protein n=1 Tax=Vigna unguiculata TaxID=3917 RepID=A0A4D6MJ75_VIGUN|nr:hypothetical protein DEO72_LG7g1323 [Vigna unguiculata]